ncbi:MAG: hypothetical protein AB7T49_03650 [Oligoflexales bacterium]
MPIWNCEKVKSTPSIVSPFDPKRINGGAYELALGDAAITDETGKPKHLCLDVRESFEIFPGQFAILLTSEIIKIPTDVQGRISIKYKIKSRGLVNISGFHVDPGFEGRLKFAVQNAGGQAITLQQGQVLFQLWCEDMSGPCSAYGFKDEHNYITASDLDCLKGHPFSPSSVQHKVEEIAKESSIKRVACVTIAGSFVVALTIVILTTMMKISPATLDRFVMAATDRISPTQSLAGKNLNVNSPDRIESPSDVQDPGQPLPNGEDEESH